jgi:hypothetical protein
MKTNAFSILSYSMICCIALFIGGCSEESVEKNDSKQISTVNTMKHPLRERDDTLMMPLTPNSAWFFDISYQDVNTGKFLEPNADFPFPSGDTLYVHGSTMLDSNPCSLIRTISTPKGGTWYTVRAKGIYSWPQDPQDTTEVPVFSLTYKYPAIKGETYKANGVKVEVKDTAAKLTVPAGSFSCYYYVSLFNAPGNVSFENHVWLSKGVGMVKNESIMYQKGIDPVRRIVSLRRYIHGTDQKQ